MRRSLSEDDSLSLQGTETTIESEIVVTLEPGVTGREGSISISFPVRMCGRQKNHSSLLRTIGEKIAERASAKRREFAAAASALDAPKTSRSPTTLFSCPERLGIRRTLAQSSKNCASLMHPLRPALLHHALEARPDARFATVRGTMRPAGTPPSAVTDNINGPACAPCRRRSADRSSSRHPAADHSRTRRATRGSFRRAVPERAEIPAARRPWQRDRKD